MDVPDEQRLLTRAEVAEYLRVPMGTIRRWGYVGTGPRYKIVGRHARYRWDDLQSWINSQDD